MRKLLFLMLIEKFIRAVEADEIMRNEKLKSWERQRTYSTKEIRMEFN